MNVRMVLILINAVVVAVFVLAVASTMSAAEPNSKTDSVTGQTPQANRPHYESFVTRLQKQWRVNPLIAERHNLQTGWENPACGPGRTTALGEGWPDTQIKCVQSCLKDISLDNPGAILQCRRNCL